MCTTNWLLLFPQSEILLYRAAGFNRPFGVIKMISPCFVLSISVVMMSGRPEAEQNDRCIRCGRIPRALLVD